jgi:hypothetical protein
MRSLSSQMQSVSQAKVLRPILLVDMLFDSGAVYLWNGNGTLTNNSNAYIGVGELISLGTISEKTDLTATGVSITLSGVKQSLLSISLSEPYQNREVIVRVGAMNESGDVIADPVVMFQGKMDVMTIQDDGNLATITVQCESKLLQLDRANLRRYTAEDQKIDYPADTALDFMAKIQEVAIPWGIPNSATGGSSGGSGVNGGGGNNGWWNAR